MQDKTEAKAYAHGLIEKQGITLRQLQELEMLKNKGGDRVINLGQHLMEIQRETQCNTWPDHLRGDFNDLVIFLMELARPAE